MNKKILFFILFIIFIAYNILSNSNQLTSSTSQKPIKACIILLLQNKDLDRLKAVMQRFELVFNKDHHYPYVLFNSEEFSKEFKQEIVKFTNSTIEFALIEKEQWSVPNWIDQKKFNLSLKNIGFTPQYRHMCRFYSGFFFRHEITLKYDYYMRLDTDSVFLCDLNSDPFVKLKNENLKYGFIIANNDGAFTVPTLWDNIKKWVKNQSLNLNSATNKKGISFISKNNGETLSDDLCVFYNNFEMGSFSLYRDKNYINFFDYLDKSGGFYYERWVFVVEIFNLFILIKFLLIKG